jgi:hypothetical protein
MRWTVQDILDYADELADRFEAFDPTEAEEVPVAEYLLQRAVRARVRSQAQLVEALTTALEAGTSWARIGTILGTSAQAAQQRYGAIVARA